MTERLTTTDRLPKDRPICYRDGDQIVVRIYRECEFDSRRLRDFRSSLNRRGFVRQPKQRGTPYETYHLRIRIPSDGRLRQPIILSERFGVRYVTAEPFDELIGQVRTGIIKRGDGYEIISRERWVCG